MNKKIIAIFTGKNKDFGIYLKNMKNWIEYKNNVEKMNI